MRILFLLIIVFLFFLSMFSGEAVTDEDEKKVYVIYMGGAADSSKDLVRSTHVQLLASVLDSEEQVEKRLVHSYNRGFSGCAAKLTAQEAHTIAQQPEVISVFEDPIIELHTTRSWDFLQYGADMETDSRLSLGSHSWLRKGIGSRGSGTDKGGADTIIGILDTGIWPESESFDDKGLGPIPSQWKGVCMEGYNFNASHCNRKLIGARYYNQQHGNHSHAAQNYDESQTPRDEIGHGTHTASTAAGSPVPGVSYSGLAAGTARGGSPGSRIAAYRVCISSGCYGSTILAGFDDAIGDGVDVLSLSLGSPSSISIDFSNDPIAIGSFHAVEKRITVVCSAGNGGPNTQTVVNTAPWILTVGATSIDREFKSDVVLGGNKVVKGKAINFSKLKKSPVYPLVYGKPSSGASYCHPDPDMIDGKIVVCERSDSAYSRKDIMNQVKDFGGIGLVLVDDSVTVTVSYGDFPMTVISSKEAAASIQSYVRSTKKPVATILPTKSVIKQTPAPVVVFFSSRGPTSTTFNLLKPDIAAPGVNILAAWIDTNKTSNAPASKKSSKFNLLSGTSMSCPHVSGVAATIKSMNPSWSPSAIRSAIMTTANQKNNEKSPIMTDLGSIATPYDYGAGEVSPSNALRPGLVYEATTMDYLQFLCNYGEDVPTIKRITKVPKGFSCPKNSSLDLISQLNYPSIAISDLTVNNSKSVTRTVTNVGDDDGAIYTVSVTSPKGVNVKVVPARLKFRKDKKKLSYQVVFSTGLSSPKDDYVFGSVTWTNGKYKVQSPFVVHFGRSFS